MIFYIKWSLLAVVLIGLLSTTSYVPLSQAQDGLGAKPYDAWTLSEVRKIDEEIEAAMQNALPEYVFDRHTANEQERTVSRVMHTSLSPNGEFVLVSLQLGDPSEENTGGLCLYTLSNQNINCSLMPTYAYFESESLLRWSPDWRYVVFHTNFVEFQRNSDLWLFDTQSGLTENITPDADPSARWGTPEALTGDVYFDGAVTWQAGSRSFYFWRYILGEERPVSTYLMHYQIGNSAPTEVAFFENITEPNIGYARQFALNDNETQMAFVTYNAQVLDRGLWLYNFASGETQQIISGRELKTHWNDDKNLFFENVQWQGDQLFIYVDRDRFDLAPEYILLDPATVNIKTMIDLGTQRTAETLPYFNRRSVRWSALSDNGAVLLYFSEGNLFTLPSNLDGEPHLVAEFSTTLLYDQRELYRITENGRLLIDDMLFQFE